MKWQDIEKDFTSALNAGDIEKVKFYVSLVKKRESQTREMKKKMSILISRYKEEEYDPGKLYDILTKKYGES